MTWPKKVTSRLFRFFNNDGKTHDFFCHFWVICVKSDKSSNEPLSNTRIHWEDDISVQKWSKCQNDPQGQCWSKSDRNRLKFACQGHDLDPKWHFWHKRVKSDIPLRWSNYKARIHWERAQIGPKWSKTPKNPILTHFGHVSRGGLSDIPEDVQNRPRSTRSRMSRPWSGSKMGFLVKNAKKWKTAQMVKLQG